MNQRQLNFVSRVHPDCVEHPPGWSGSKTCTELRSPMIAKMTPPQGHPMDHNMVQGSPRIRLVRLPQWAAHTWFSQADAPRVLPFAQSWLGIPTQWMNGWAWSLSACLGRHKPLEKGFWHTHSNFSIYEHMTTKIIFDRYLSWTILMGKSKIFNRAVKNSYNVFWQCLLSLLGAKLRTK